MADNLTCGADIAHPEGPSAETSIVAFARGASIEVTQPSHEDIERMASILPGGTEIFISDVPRRSAGDIIQACAAIAAAGLVPVPHIAVRRIESAAALERLVAGCVKEGGVAKAMLVAGDHDDAAGPFGDVADALSAGVLRDRGLREVSVAGYPEGHPRIPADRLARALETKLALLAARGIEARIVTQFGFDGDALERYVLHLRQKGVRCPVLVGLAGPASAATLTRFALRCGVRIAGRMLARDRRRVGDVLFGGGSEQLLARLSSLAADGRGGRISPHFFSFGGGFATAKWIRALQDGRLQSV
jgi:methylenetetrahydrofolate reductase (NADPH)